MNQLEKNIAINLRRLRKSRNMSLDMLSEQTGVSKSMLGQIERGESNPTIATIGRIIEGIEISFDELISNPSNSVEIVKKEDVLVYNSKECNIYGYKTCDNKKSFELYNINILPGGKYEAPSHGDWTRKFVVVNKGLLKVLTGEEEYVIEQGDAIDFITDKTHTFVNATKDELKLQVVFYEEAPKNHVHNTSSMI